MKLLSDAANIISEKLMHETSESLLWFKRLKCGNCIPIVCNHTLPALILNQENRIKHPNWYAEESPGKTYPGFFDQGGVPRYTDPDFQRAAIEWARKLFDTYPDSNRLLSVLRKTTAIPTTGATEKFMRSRV